MRNTFFISITFFLFFNVLVNSQSKLIGKTYKSEISASCKEMNDGGCMIYNYCILEFEKNIVKVLDMQTKSGDKVKRHFYN